MCFKIVFQCSFSFSPFLSLYLKFLPHTSVLEGRGGRVGGGGGGGGGGGEKLSHPCLGRGTHPSTT